MKQLVERRVCDFGCTDDAINPGQCILCGRDFCMRHGAVWRPHITKDEWGTLDMCKECVKRLRAEVPRLFKFERGGR